MNLDALKDQLGDETHGELLKFVEDLTGQRDAARQESIKHRTSLKAKAGDLEQRNLELQRAQEEMLERLGVESMDQLKELDPKGQADAMKQYEAKLKRVEKDAADRQAAYDELHGRYRGSLQMTAMTKAMQSHEWIDSDLVSSFVSARLVMEDDQVLYRMDDGVTVSLAEGLQTLAKDKPHLLKAAGAGGSGYRGKAANADAKPELTRAQLDALTPADRVKFFKSGGSLLEN
jgi:hypothetical protein